MTDLSMTIDPKSDQINADDLIAGPRTITITRVVGNSDKNQPISIFFEGDKGKPYKPCKSMRRVLVQLWDKDGNTYVGKAMTLFRDSKVQFGDIEVGGIRISHLSHIESDVTLMLTTKRGRRESFQVKKLVAQATNNEGIEAVRAIQSATSLAELEALTPVITSIRDRKAVPPAEFKMLRERYAEKQAELKAAALPASDTNGAVDGDGYDD